MTNKKCLVFETLNAVNGLQIQESKNNEVRLHGVFGVCGVKNGNNRIYNKENYGRMVEALQQCIITEGCPGELEHPNSMNINLENISHKIEDIQMNEDGTITGTILLLNTPKGQIAKAIVEGGLPLYISSRGAGSIDESGNVTLSTIKTYDLVGTPGFSQAKLTLAEHQTMEALNENLCVIYEGDLLGDDDDDDKKEDDKKDEKEDKKSEKKSDKKEDTKSEETEDKESDEKEDEKTDEETDDKSEDADDKSDDKKENNNKETDDITMKDLMEKIDKLSDKIESLEADLHIAKESLAEVKPVNYDAIEAWVKEEFATEFKSEVNESIDELKESIETLSESVEETVATAIDEATVNIANGVQNWVCEEFAPEVQNWVCEEFAPEVQNWVCEEFAPEVQNWITEEFAPEVQNWITEEFAPVVEGWVNEEFAPEHKESIMTEVNENVNAFFEAKNNTRFEEINALLETIDAKPEATKEEALEIMKEAQKSEKYAGVYVVENMPAAYRPLWEMLDEAQQVEIIRSSRMYDFTKEGVLESFWATANLTKAEPVNENEMMPEYHSNIMEQMKRLRRI